MSTDLANLWSEGSRSSKTAWLTVAILLLTLILGVSGSFASVDGADRGNDAYAARYEAMAEFYEASAARGNDATAARYGAMAEFYLASAGDESDLLAANPELMIARRSSRASTNTLAANPELMLARRWQTQSASALGSCSPAEVADLAANPELLVVRRMGDVC